MCLKRLRQLQNAGFIFVLLVFNVAVKLYVLLACTYLILFSIGSIFSSSNKSCVCRRWTIVITSLAHCTAGPCPELFFFFFFFFSPVSITSSILLSSQFSAKSLGARQQHKNQHKHVLSSTSLATNFLFFFFLNNLSLSLSLHRFPVKSHTLN